jgi:hypothetical protein
MKNFNFKNPVITSLSNFYPEQRKKVPDVTEPLDPVEAHGLQASVAQHLSDLNQETISSLFNILNLFPHYRYLLNTLTG